MGFRLSCMRFVNMIITTNPSLDNRIAVRNDFLALDLLVVCNKIIGDTRKSLLEESLEEKSSTPTSPSNHVNVRKSSVFTSPNGGSPSGGSGDLTISVDGSEGVMGDGKATTAELLEAFTTQVEVFEGSMQEDGESIRREGGRREREKRQGEQGEETGRVGIQERREES